MKEGTKDWIFILLMIILLFIMNCLNFDAINKLQETVSIIQYKQDISEKIK